MRSKPKKTIRTNAVWYMMMTPFMLVFVIFLLIPVLSSIVLSFTSFDMVRKPDFVGFDNYVRLLFNDDVFMKAFQNTLVLAVITGPIGFLLSFVVAWLINEMKPSVRKFITLIMYAPSLAGNVYFIWLFIFSGDSKGLANTALMSLGIIQDPINWLTDSSYNMAVVIIVTVWLSLGTGFLSFVAGLQSLDRSYFEAAAIDGIKNRWQELFYVTLPQMGPQLMFGAVMTISSAFSVGYINQALTGFPSTNYSTHTLLLHMLDFGTVRFEMGYSSAIAVVLFGFMLITWMIINKILKRYSED